MKSLILTVQKFKELVKQLRKCKAYVKELETANKLLNDRLDAYNKQFTTKDV